MGPFVPFLTLLKLYNSSVRSVLEACSRGQTAEASRPGSGGAKAEPRHQSDQPADPQPGGFCTLRSEPTGPPSLHALGSHPNLEDAPFCHCCPLKILVTLEGGAGCFPVSPPDWGRTGWRLQPVNEGQEGLRQSREEEKQWEGGAWKPELEGGREKCARTPGEPPAA